MTKSNTNSKKGFTIIEVVLVLAIAGLIFLMVFVALPNLQRTQRDTQRRNDLDRLSTSLTQYITNNSHLPNSNGNPVGAFYIDEEGIGTAPNQNWGNFATNYLLADGEDNFMDPNGDPYRLSVTYTDSSTDIEDNFDQSGIMVVAPNRQCGSEDSGAGIFEEVTQGRESSRRYAVAMRLESNGIYCVDNS